MSSIRRIRAEKLEAGDTIVIKDGSIRKFFHVCEVFVDQEGVTFGYDTKSGKEVVECEHDDVLRIRIR